jgi:hypothetical protein
MPKPERKVRNDPQFLRWRQIGLQNASVGACGRRGVQVLRIRAKFRRESQLSGFT